MDKKSTKQNFANLLLQNFLAPFGLISLGLSILFYVIPIDTLGIIDRLSFLEFGLILGYLSFVVLILNHANKFELYFKLFFESLFIGTLIILGFLETSGIFIDSYENIFNAVLPILFSTSLGCGFLALLLQNKDKESKKKECQEIIVVGRKNLLFSISFLILALFFVAIKIAMPILYNGSYSDEYYHITSGLAFISTGHFPQIYYGQTYTRDSYVSILVGVLLAVFGNSIFIAKLLPAIMGIINFFLLFLIARRLLPKQYILFLLLLYLVSPWVLLNDFYIRSYVFYETFAYLVLLGFLKLSRGENRILSIGSIVLINMLLFLFDRGPTSNLINAITFFALVYYLIKIDNEAIRYYLKILSRKFWYLTVTSIAIIGGTLLIGPFLYTSVYQLLFSSLDYYNQAYGYGFLFFNLNVVITLVFLIGVGILFREKSDDKGAELVYAATLGMFVLHNLTTRDAQTVRAVFYLFPLLYLSALIILSRIKLPKIIKLLACLLFLVNIYINYPLDFFNYPYINAELMYYQEPTSSDISPLCNGKIVITSNRPDILLFNGIKTDYWLNTEYSDPNWIATDSEASYAYLDPNADIYRYTDTGTPVIASESSLAQIVTNSKNGVCLITGLMPYDWLDNQTQAYIAQNFVLVHEYNSSTNTSAIRLYVTYTGTIKQVVS